MCYKQPGPRCSAHALNLLEKAKQAKKNDPRENFSKSLQLSQKIKEAQFVFDTTPAGLRILEEEIARNTPDKNDLQARYDLAKELRHKQLQAVKNLNLIQKEHKNVTPTQKWLAQLNDKEIAALRWMTDHGTMQANTHIAGVNDYKLFKSLYSPVFIHNQMKIVDTALAKYETTETTTVYRGVREGSLPKFMQQNYHMPDILKQEEFLKHYQPGTIVDNEYYMPTSIETGIAERFSDFNIILKIESKHATPVSSLSISETENESLIPRNTKFLVQNVEENQTLGKLDQQYTIITLVEQ
jgi:hypothetical protein